MKMKYSISSSKPAHSGMAPLVSDLPHVKVVQILQTTHPPRSSFQLLDHTAGNIPDISAIDILSNWSAYCSQRHLLIRVASFPGLGYNSLCFCDVKHCILLLTTYGVESSSLCKMTQFDSTYIVSNQKGKKQVLRKQRRGHGAKLVLSLFIFASAFEIRYAFIKVNKQSTRGFEAYVLHIDNLHLP